MAEYARAYTNSTSTKGEGKQKTTESQIKETENNVQRVYELCVGYPLEMIFPNAL